MSLRGGDERELVELHGKRVVTARQGIDNAGYGFVRIEFGDGTVLVVGEYSQDGQIEVIIEGQARHQETRVNLALVKALVGK